MPGWWDCKCGYRSNPPALENCMRCRGSRAEGEKPPVPPPKRDHPDDPYGWWSCKECGEESNTPTSQRCMKCFRRRPGSVSNPEPPKVPQPDLPKPPSGDMSLKVKVFLGTITSLIGTLLVVWFWMPAQLRMILVAVKEILKAIISLLAIVFFLTALVAASSSVLNYFLEVL